ncbi:1-(5-phosphoribosyl)-5-[(5-phosphoribosylamino)methylideneamino]imidazole-4-carboxamide isomerase [Sporosarcina sp. P21c]|uniref:1-(5-phosphoribosyl)-5-[(5- phosphoribosylamino)methylideneamino]imidazole-4- carboxamide isomerase n=1 Tax=unclassified Sporosarcina TaxID=2647733 RepID=UPI000C16A298|nr:MULTISPECIES: 1-(5-phosphoribosyl)-5-[(5-phosphoribosylamino)methylideneamino]imidazole-4-carboxamide isomerase [unclassified Sporosarcina]PIC67074.1 1-(5-phosphoribosyl)-5-[(5-phosphoribosylamino)methylideneamino]imidazole-4-carboxamide isomerase [Sporosarcina sp. P16a]PIC83415.1 1-(5-phosphoribosyl)-5-[(5-phosphoribosylamino)methylideneamino]imidazole-4-carboxamide isomerase [Sporosarcina sp. P1]PIC89799.1 1-(5-phosphoribosyl)-5-[(5-phosphoribosylamino)methylideneamino]imidazole-4-carboxami
MILFPAIDIRDGKCVRLIQGDYAQEIIYNDSPTNMAQEWQNQGAEYIHVVDLDGAKTGNSANKKAIEAIAKAVSIPVQVGGGIRNMDIVDSHIENGVARVIIGTAAIQDPEFLKKAVEKYGDKIAVSIDARNGLVATDGWTETSDVKAVDLLQDLAEIGVRTVVYTDIMKDGMLQGPNFEELKIMDDASSIDIIASGGVSTEEDIQKLAAEDMYGAIIGKALYEGNLSLKKLLGDDSHVNN